MSEGAIPVPRLVAWEVTRRCNLKCRHCRASAGDCAVEGELSLDEAKAVVDDIASFAKPVLILTGGEPLMCEWVWDIIAYARERGMTPAVGTNGTLVDDEVARRLAASGVKRISVSLDFPTAGAHDEFRGVEGAFDAAALVLQSRKPRRPAEGAAGSEEPAYAPEPQADRAEPAPGGDGKG